MSIAKPPIWIVVCLGLGSILLIGCLPPHVNPLDPESAHYIPPDHSEPPPGFCARVRSVHTSRNIPSTDTYSVLCEAWSDQPGQIDSAWVGYHDWPPAGMRLSTQSVWSALLASSYFSDPQLGSVVGQPFTFFFQASNESTYAAGPVYLFRVIEATPTLMSPRNGEVVGPRPVLSWDAFTASYPFSFRVTVTLTAGEYEAVVWSRDGLAHSLHEIAVTDSLENGSYYWTLHVVDSFENTSRSKEGLFRVDVEVNL